MQSVVSIMLSVAKFQFIIYLIASCIIEYKASSKDFNIYDNGISTPGLAQRLISVTCALVNQL